VKRAVVLKLGGELLEDATRLRVIARLIAKVSRTTRLIVVHGGGKEIDAALAQASIPKHQVDGLRVTDEGTLHVVISVLAGAVKTRLVAAINVAGGRAVGLSAVDAGVMGVAAAPPHRATNGELVDLGLVGEPVDGRGAPLIDVLCGNGFTPVVSPIGAAKDGRIFNVNADTLAGSLAARLRAARLVMAGSTAGVLDDRGKTIASLDGDGIDALIGLGAASAGMVAKLRAGRHALERGVKEVVIAAGDSRRLSAVVVGTTAGRGPWTRLG